MAVAVYNAGTAAVQATPESWLNASCSIGGSDRLLLFVLQLYTSGSAPTSVAATCNTGSMVLIDSWTSGGVYHYVFAKLADDAGWIASSWTNTCYAVGHCSSYTGVTQVSEAAAVTTATHASGTSTSPSVTLASASGNLVVGHFSSAPTTITVNDTTLFGETAWGSGSYESCGNYASGATSVTLDLSLTSSVAWSAQAVNIASITAGGTWSGSASFAAAGGLTANAVITSPPTGGVAFEAGVVDSDRTNTSPGFELTVTPNGSANQALLVMLQLDPVSTSPSIVTADCNSVAMTLIHSDTAGTVKFYMWGTILGATNALQTITFFWDQLSSVMTAAAVFSGVVQTSVAAAFTNATSATGVAGNSSVTVTSATNNLVVGHVQCVEFFSAGDTLLFLQDEWPTGGPIYDSAGSYAAGAASITLDYTSSGGWRAQGVNIVAAPVPHQGSATFAAAAGIAASGRLIQPAVAALAAAGALSSAARLSAKAAATFAGAAALTASATVVAGYISASASLAAAGGLSSAARLRVGAQALLPAAGALTAAVLESANLLLHCDGSDASTTFTDSSGKAHAVTANGNAQIDTAQSKFGGASAYTSDGTGWLGLDGSADFNFGTGDFTIDFWVRATSVGGQNNFYVHDVTSGPIIYQLTSSVNMYAQGANRIGGGAGNMFNGTWHHLALTRASGSSRLFVDGVQVGSTFSDGLSYSSASGAPNILSQAGTFSSECWIDELRVIKGTAVWTANFTPPTSPYGIFIGQSISALLAAAGGLSSAARLRARAQALLPAVGALTAATVEPAVATLLLHCDGADASTTFTDTSGNAHTVTAAGNAQVDTAQSKFGGASALFDGTDDSLLLPTTSAFAFGAGDFTIDFWVRPTADGTYIGVDFRPSGATGIYPTLYWSGGFLRYFVNGADVIVSTSKTWANNWWHIALTRSGSDHRLFVNGVQEGTTWTLGGLDYLVGTPTIGGTSNLAGAFSVPGWMDEVRIVKGTAAWTANFTPPTSPYADAFIAEQLVAQFNALAGLQAQAEAVSQFSVAASLAAVGALQAYATQRVAARSTLAVAAALQAANVYIIQAWAGSATLASAGALQASAGLYTFMGATVDARGGLTATTFSPKFATATLRPAGALAVDAFAFLTITFRAAGGLAAISAVNVSPPFVGPTHLKGTGIYEALYTNLNSQMEMLVASGTLVGRTSPQRGDAEVITIGAPLKLQDGKLSLDIDELKDLLGLP